MNKTFIITSALVGALTVALGAFGAHALKERLNEYALGILKQRSGISFIMFSP